MNYASESNVCVAPDRLEACYVTVGWGSTSPGPPGWGAWLVQRDGPQVGRVMRQRSEGPGHRGAGADLGGQGHGGASLCPHPIHFSVPPLNLHPQSPQDVKERPQKMELQETLKEPIYPAPLFQWFRVGKGGLKKGQRCSEQERHGGYR